MFTEGDGAPRASGGEAITTVPTLWLVKLGMEAVKELFKQHRDAVHKSWGEPIDKEEALGYLVCDALGTELTPTEARRIGKDATLAMTRNKTGAKVVEGQLKGAAAAKKAKARAAAKKHPERAEGLDKTLDALDAEGKAALVQLWSSELDLKIPQGPLVATAQPRPAAAAAAAAKAVQAARAAQQAAQVAVGAAEGKVGAAKAAHKQAEQAGRAALQAVELLGVPGQLPSEPMSIFGWLVKQQDAALAQDSWPAHDSWPTSALYRAATTAYAAWKPHDTAIRLARMDVLDAEIEFDSAEEALEEATSAVRRAERAEAAHAEAAEAAKQEAAEAAAEVAAEQAATRAEDAENEEFEAQGGWADYRERQQAATKAKAEAAAREPKVFKLTGMDWADLNNFAACMGVQEKGWSEPDKETGRRYNREVGNLEEGMCSEEAYSHVRECMSEFGSY